MSPHGTKQTSRRGCTSHEATPHSHAARRRHRDESECPGIVGVGDTCWHVGAHRRDCIPSCPEQVAATTALRCLLSTTAKGKSWDLRNDSERASRCQACLSVFTPQPPRRASRTPGASASARPSRSCTRSEAWRRHCAGHGRRPPHTTRHASGTPDLLRHHSRVPR